MWSSNRSTIVTRRGSFLFAGLALAAAACARSGGGQPGVGAQLSDAAARRFYQLRGWKAAWDSASADALHRAVAGATAHGLHPAAFAPRVGAGPQSDEALTLAALAYAKALAVGLVDPHKVQPIFTLERNAIDLAAGLDQALTRDDLEAWLGGLAPADPEYKALSAAYTAALGQPASPSNAANAAPAAAFVAPSDEARQLAVNLERRRWLMRSPPAHRIDVNTAVAVLGYLKPGQPTVALRTVVGLPSHPTPSIQASFQRLVANPPWRVPTDIAEKEILPKGQAYLAREDMRYVDGRLEQAAGPKSALGRVKFDVQDPFDIYLHDTPSKALFDLPQRHRSHGCVRVAGAVDFARAIAAETGRADDFDQALASQDTRTVDLGQSIAVRTLYHTAYLDQSGAVQFAPDVYGWDETLAAALGYSLAAAAVASTPNEPPSLFGP